MKQFIQLGAVTLMALSLTMWAGACGPAPAEPGGDAAVEQPAGAGEAGGTASATAAAEDVLEQVEAVPEPEAEKYRALDLINALVVDLKARSGEMVTWAVLTETAEANALGDAMELLEGEIEEEPASYPRLVTLVGGGEASSGDVSAELSQLAAYFVGGLVPEE